MKQTTCTCVDIFLEYCWWPFVTRYLVIIIEDENIHTIITIGYKELKIEERVI